MPQISQAQFCPDLIRGVFLVWVVVDFGAGAGAGVLTGAAALGARAGAAFLTAVRGAGRLLERDAGAEAAVGGVLVWVILSLL